MCLKEFRVYPGYHPHNEYIVVTALSPVVDVVLCPEEFRVYHGCHTQNGEVPRGSWKRKIKKKTKTLELHKIYDLKLLSNSNSLNFPSKSPIQRQKDKQRSRYTYQTNLFTLLAAVAKIS